MAAACLASFAIFASILAVLYGLDWYKNRKQNRNVSRRIKEEDYNNAKEPLVEQLA